MSINSVLIIDDSKTSKAIFTASFAALGIEFDIVSTETSAWGLIENREYAYGLVLVSRSILGQEIRSFVYRFRLLSDYVSVPLILLVGDKNKTHDEESIYNAGFTQVFSRTELDDLRAYIQQVQSRNTFDPARKNKVVIIEDSITQQIMVRAILEAEFCECFCFTSAEAALAKMDVIQPQVIACDFFLDGKMTALEFLVHVKNTQNPWQDVPILPSSCIKNV